MLEKLFEFGKVLMLSLGGCIIYGAELKREIRAATLIKS